MASEKATSNLELVLNLKDMIATGRHSDLTISCGEKTFRVHKVILDCSSRYFNKLLSGDFKEANEGMKTIELKDDDAEALEALIWYFYNFTYNDKFVKNRSTMAFAVKVYSIADKYDVPKLQQLAAKKFKGVCILNDNADDVNDFVGTINLVQECANPNDRTLWDILLPVIESNISCLLKSKEFRGYVLDNPELNITLLSMLEQPSGHYDAGTNDDDSQGDWRPSPYGSGRRLG